MLSKNINRKVLPKVWKFLDKLLKKDEIEIVTFDPADLAITFRADTPLSGGDHQVLASVSSQKLRCTVSVEWMEIEAELYHGKFLKPESAIRPLSVLLPKPRVFVDLRSEFRLDHVARVCSAYIPQFQAMTSDLSLSGMKLKTVGPMEVDLVFDCQIEFDDYTMTRLDFKAEVRWCRPAGEHWEVGAFFVETPRSTRLQLANFVRTLNEVEKGVLQDSYRY
jgi:hypothetical protein|tara:strand:- start:276 stop:938 length:663 start_codon:yes stop_codon:yes gene_type:complete